MEKKKLLMKMILPNLHELIFFSIFKTGILKAVWVS